MAQKLTATDALKHALSRSPQTAALDGPGYAHTYVDMARALLDHGFTYDPETGRWYAPADVPVQTYFVRVLLRYEGSNRVERRGITVYARNESDAKDFAVYRFTRYPASPAVEDVVVQRIPQLYQ